MTDAAVRYVRNEYKGGKVTVRFSCSERKSFPSIRVDGDGVRIKNVQKSLRIVASSH